MINFVLNGSEHYLGVQAQILDQIKMHLPPDSWREGIDKYVRGCLNFTLFIRKEADVFMSHGVADKNYHWKKDKNGDRYNTLRRHTHLLVPGAWLRDRIIASTQISYDSEHVHSVGWPRLDMLIAASKNYVKDDAPSRRRRVLWAPTHDYNRKGREQISASSYPEFESYLPELQKHADVEVSLHPRNRTSKKPTHEKLLEADFVIADFGTIVYEAWALGKPVIFPHWLIGNRVIKYLSNSAEGHIFKNRIGMHAESFDALISLLEGPASIDQTTKDFLNNYLEPSFLGCSGKRIADLLLELDKNS